ncbi:ROK family transcriptional regulator [Phytoactinopolyspora limicola]|uniref:ROK family transcriptional regulator n=1 Tax=Phytoactinopolyspora limicola TaxID=2715536 RepID=UPI001409EB96|nr:ROK family transcriptional regulator [Phytoactinopolyspora limicola]
MTLLATGQITSRSDIARELGLAPSTVSLRVNELIETGIIVEAGTGRSTGGRRPRVLELNRTAGHVLVADLGGKHARVALVDLLGQPRQVEEVELDITEGPPAVLDRLATALTAMAKTGDSRTRGPEPSSDPGLGDLRGTALTLPGPVDVDHGWVDSPSRMPGWHRFPVRDWLVERFGVPCVIENDANAMALAAHHAHQPSIRHSIFAKAGTAIGCGLVIDGVIHRGSTGAAGDLTHVRVAAADHRACSCGNAGCLETIASGSALVQHVRADGMDVHTTTDVVAAARDADPIATTRIRSAGRALGETLSPVVNFVNPDAVFLGGVLSVVEPFVAAVRSQLYEGCHPLVTRDLYIGQSPVGIDAGVLGASRAILDHVLTPALN